MDFQRLFDILPYQQAKYPQKIALAGKENGQWKTWSTEAALQAVEKLSVGLRRAGLAERDCVAIFAHCGSPAWNLLDFAVQQLGAVVVPIHATTLPNDIAYILEDACVHWCFASNAAMANKLRDARPQGLSILTFEKTEGFRHWEELLVEPTEAEKSSLQETKDCLEDTRLATILYTSGTTGTPKGVLLTHRNIVSNIKAIMTLVPVHYRMNALSFLPLSHIFERMVTSLYMAAGASIWYADSIETVSDDCKTVRPNFFTAVPRVLERMYDRALETRKNKGWLGKKVFDMALAWGENFDLLEKLSPVFWLRHQLYDWLVYRHWRKALGGKLEGMVVGAAALQPRLARLFCAAGIPVREGYGLTETSPVVSFNRFDPGLYEFGTVGIPIPGMEVKINDPDERGEGEILVKGPNVMQGYHRLPDETAAAFTPDGWLRTGDAGKFVKRRFLQITGRKKDFFKTSSGKYVAPQRVENQLLQSPFIKQCMVTGLNQPYPAALLVPNFIALEQWCQENNIHWTAPQFMALNPRIQKFMTGVVEACNQQLEPHEQVRRFHLLHEEWTVTGGELSPTLKVMRRVLEEKFARELKELFE
jgi:long-chain acyl-CoA synthetase